jgi:hypothetical protein
MLGERRMAGFAGRRFGAKPERVANIYARDFKTQAELLAKISAVLAPLIGVWVKAVVHMQGA